MKRGDVALLGITPERAGPLECRERRASPADGKGRTNTWDHASDFGNHARSITALLGKRERHPYRVLLHCLGNRKPHGELTGASPKRGENGVGSSVSFENRLWFKKERVGVSMYRDLSSSRYREELFLAGAGKRGVVSVEI